jgi:hypothetical protein
VGNRRAGSRCESLGALKFHIQPAVTLGGERYTNNVARVSNGKTGQLRVGKDRTTFRLGDDVWQFAGAVQHKQQFSEKCPEAKNASGGAQEVCVPHCDRLKKFWLIRDVLLSVSLLQSA